MLGLHEHFFVAAPRDSLESLPESEGTNKLGASFETPCGRRLVVHICMKLAPPSHASQDRKLCSIFFPLNTVIHFLLLRSSLQHIWKRLLH